MKDTDQSEIKRISRQTLTTMADVAGKAASALDQAYTSGAESLTTINTWNDSSPVSTLSGISEKNRADLARIAEAPGIQRVVARVNGQEATYYILPATPHGFAASDTLVAYGSPLGRLAVFKVGEEDVLVLPGGDKSVLVLERARFTPRTARGGQWDGIDAVIETRSFGPTTILSLQALFDAIKSETADSILIDAVIAAEAAAQNVFEGLRRSTLERMSLRELSSLDRYQDEIFRLPLSRRLLILGPPGTGKTTTLVKRLGQKLDPSLLTPDERALLGSTRTSIGEHIDSWQMFTPTELLRLYLKEAFARERVAASDQRISTWQQARTDLARNRTRILRTSATGGAFSLKPNLASLDSSTLRKQPQWFDDFQAFQQQAFTQELRTAIETLGTAGQADIGRLTRELSDIIGTGTAAISIGEMLAIRDLEADILAIVNARKAKTDETIRQRANVTVNADPEFLQKLSVFLDGLAAEEEESDDDLDEEDTIEVSAKTKAALALQAFSRNMRSQAKARFGGRPLPRASRAGRIAEWLGERNLDREALVEMGSDLNVQEALRRFVNVFRRLLSGMPNRYRQFRRVRQSEQKWYRPDGFNHTDIDPLEVDVILLAWLRTSTALLQNRTVRAGLEETAFADVRSARDLMRNQIMVDEATDFSPVQLAAMYSLSNPDLKSFFASGDFNQRITEWGTATQEEFEWAIPGVEMRPVTIAYRQTTQLKDLAVAIAGIGGTLGTAPSLPLHTASDGVAPALGKGLSDMGEISQWIAARIVEIEHHTSPRALPSVAVLVNQEADVGPLAKRLGEILADENLNVVPCYDGRYTGTDGDIAVFDVQHIKGLEFEAVFFVSIDQLVELRTELSEKFLYVGCTRAATFLGVTCRGNALPDRLGTLAPLFGDDWS